MQDAATNGGHRRATVTMIGRRSSVWPTPCQPRSTGWPTNGASGRADIREQVKHVACGNFAFFNEIEKGPARVTGGPNRQTKAESGLTRDRSIMRKRARSMTLAMLRSGEHCMAASTLGSDAALWHASDRTALSRTFA
jgi:hypothetical protein